MSLIKYIHSAENLGKDADLLSKVKHLLSKGKDFAGSHPEVTAALGGAAAGAGAHAALGDEDEDDDDDSAFHKYKKKKGY